MAYHISKDGVARECRAKSPESCTATPADQKEHYDTKEEAQKAYEERNQNSVTKSLQKPKVEWIEATEEDEEQRLQQKISEMMEDFDDEIDYNEPQPEQKQKEDSGYKMAGGLLFKEVEYSSREKERAAILEEYIDEYTSGKVGHQIPKHIQRMIADHIKETSYMEYYDRGVDPDKLIILIERTEEYPISVQHYNKVLKYLSFMNDLNNDILNGIELGSSRRLDAKALEDKKAAQKKAKEDKKKNSLFNKLFKTSS